ncbi:hypothetical protein [Leptolyngbya sp. FACHB-261]|uniref:hypothetical protein n=1 Tax=Leptolyngbya sp. FACHB-261 TaxID=2692806 RepID=UPI001687F896|nr:hypothetical protein [Leptolyngbya sp. FACHB-261]
MQFSHPLTSFGVTIPLAQQLTRHLTQQLQLLNLRQRLIRHLQHWQAQFLSHAFVAHADKTTANQPIAITEQTADKQALKVLVMGPPKAVDDCIRNLYRLGFAQIWEWSSAQPSSKPGEVMRILTRRVL